MLENPKENELTGVLGSVGDDFYGDLYAKLLQKENIVPLFEKFDEVNTGLCCVFCHNRDRGHITDLGASTLISLEFVQRIWDQLKNVQLIYTELFILKHRKNVVYLLAENCLSDQKLFGFNLPSAYFIENYFQDILNLIEYADVLFANAAEALFFASLLGLVNLIIFIFLFLGKCSRNRTRLH
jgi:sugar/nucleoside kinase (ribokinase family)